MKNKITQCKQCQCELAHGTSICPNCGTNNKKPFYKNWWVWVVAILVIAIATSGGDDSASNSEVNNTPNTDIESQDKESITSADETKATEVPKATEEAEDLSKVATTYELTDGYYTAGIDIPAGKCNVKAVSGTGNLSSSNLFNGGINEMFGKDDSSDLYTESFSGLKLPKDTVLQVSGGLTIQIEYTKIESNFTGREYDTSKKITLTDGNYDSGDDFPEGTYKITAISGKGNLSSSNIFDGGINEMFGKDDGSGFYTEEFLNVSLPAGTSLEVSGGLTIELIPSK